VISQSLLIKGFRGTAPTVRACGLRLLEVSEHNPTPGVEVDHRADGLTSAHFGAAFFNHQEE